MTVFPDDNKKYLSTDLSKPIEINEKFVSNKVEIIVSGFTLVDEKFSFIKKVIYNSANKVLNIDDFIDYAMTQPYFTCVKMLFRKETDLLYTTS